METEQNDIKSEPVEQKKSKKSGLIIALSIVGFILIASLAAGGYGVWNGKRIQRFALDSEKIMNEVDDWGSFNGLSDTNEMKEDIADIKKEATDFESQVKASNPPRKAKKLKDDMIEYFGLSKKMATDMENYVGWLAKIEESMKGFSDLGTDVSTPEAMTASMEKSKGNIVTAKNELVATVPPKGLEDQHKAFLKMYDGMITMYDQVITALKTNDVNALSAIGSTSSSLATDFDSIESPDKTLEKIFKADIEREDELEKSIKNQINELKIVSFSF